MIDKKWNEHDEMWDDYKDLKKWECHELQCDQENYSEYMYTRKRRGMSHKANCEHVGKSTNSEHFIAGTEFLRGTHPKQPEQDTEQLAHSGFLYKLGEKVVDLIYPPSTYCVVCDSFIDGTRKYNMCDSCIEKFQWIDEDYCQICGRPLAEKGIYICRECAEQERNFDRGFSCTAYGLYERKIISDFKKSGKAYLARTLGEILYDRIVIEDLKIDGIIPIPVHKERLKVRGFNQTELMGRYLSKKIGWPLIRDAVIRIKETEAMKQLDRWQRAKNMEGAFAVAKPEKVKNKKLIVLDDIYTSGATMQECCKVLKAQGAEKVYILTFSAGRFGI